MFVESQLPDRLVYGRRLSKKEMASEESKDSSSTNDAEGQHRVTAAGIGREGTGTGTTAVEKENKETRDNATREESKESKPKEEDKEEEEELVIEQPLLTIKEVFVYQVPPLRASSGHRAEEWGLANPVFTGE